MESLSKGFLLMKKLLNKLRVVSKTGMQTKDHNLYPWEVHQTLVRSDQKVSKILVMKNPIILLILTSDYLCVESE
jgi:hypothetical protein